MMKMVGPKSPPRKADEVARELMARIVGAEIAPGSLLPKEEELEAEFGVARSVIREAVKFLEVHKLVRPVRRRGTVVLDPRASLSPDVLATFLVPRQGRVSPDFLKGVLEIRKLLDVEMMALAAERREPTDLRSIREAANTLVQKANVPDELEDAILSFGLAVARATHNPLYVMFVHWNSNAVRDLADVFASVRASSGTHAEGIQMVVSAIESGDVSAARAMTALYHDWAGPKILAAAAAK
jgi:DNA-binding FadR family transcriptional regulator